MITTSADFQKAIENFSTIQRFEYSCFLIQSIETRSGNKNFEPVLNSVVEKLLKIQTAQIKAETSLDKKIAAASQKRAADKKRETRRELHKERDAAKLDELIAKRDAMDLLIQKALNG